MNPLDWLLAILLVYSVTRAAMRGFFKEAFALGGLLVGFLLACWYYRALGHQLGGLINSPPIAQFIAFLLILMLTMVVATVIGSLLRKSASAIGLGFADRLLGAFFGLIRGALLGVALLLAVTAFLPTAPWIQTSTLAPYLLRADHAVSFIMPSDLKTKLLDGLDRIKHTTPYWIKSGISSHTTEDSK